MRSFIKWYLIISPIILLLMLVIMCLHFNIPTSGELQAFVCFTIFFCFISIGFLTSFMTDRDLSDVWFKTTEELNKKITEVDELKKKILQIESIIGEHEAIKFYHANNKEE